MAVESLLLPAISSTSPGRSVRRSASGSEATNGSSPGASRRRRRASHRPKRSSRLSNVIMPGLLSAAHAPYRSALHLAGMRQWSSSRHAHLGGLAALHDGGDTHAAGGAHGDEAAPAVLGEQLGEVADDARAGGRKRVAEGEA